MKTEKIKIKGMHCTSCEEVIEKQVLKIDGVKACKADYAKQSVVVTFDESKTDIGEIKGKIEEKQYECDSSCDNDARPKSASASTGISRFKPAILTLALVAVLFGGYQLVQGFAVFDLPTIGGPASLALLFGIGLLTGFHCVGMCGGFVMSYAAKPAAGRKNLNVYSHIQYGTGKLISYTVIGALFGLIGTIFVFTPLLKGAASIFAGLFLIIFGINMLNVFPQLRKARLPMPKFISRFVFANSDKQRRPLATGLLNGLMIACGPLQALYIYAAGTGSVASGALALFAFGLGTLPVMFGFGMFASYVTKGMTRNILKASGLIVIVLGLVMLNRGLALTGTGYDLNTMAASFIPVVQAQGATNSAGNGAIASSGQFQEIRMNVTSGGWEPDRFVLKAGVPVRWIINGVQITSCNKAIQVPKLGLQFDIKQGEQVIEFTPPNEDTIIPWSCWMGMIQGTFIVKTNIDLSNQQQVQSELSAAGPAKTSGGSCGGANGGSCGGSCGMAKGGTCGCGG
ncbi:MAG: sulfite exporter TauE/SafE family protein [Candidatus Aenigmatarchaeota archaeon]